MLTRLIIFGGLVLLGIVIYFVVRAAMNRGSKSSPSPRSTPPVDIVDRPTASTGSPKFESPEDRIARLEEELRRLGDEEDESRPGHS